METVYEVGLKTTEAPLGIETELLECDIDDARGLKTTEALLGIETLDPVIHKILGIKTTETLLGIETRYGSYFHLYK